MKRDIFGWLGVVLLLLGGLTLSAPFVLQAIDSAGQTASAESAALPTPDGRRMIEEAKAYNESLAGRPQSVLGEAGYTFSGTSYSGGDKEYRGLLDADGEGTMGAVRYPRLHISLPVRHGTDAATLEKSAGHLYGTSLPVGGESTHAVVAAHRGLADRLMFTNLGLAKKGDLFEIDVQGERLRYKVTDIRVTGPDDVRPLAIEKGRDLMTLYTCTPYGVNTQRLLVTGERTDAPSGGDPGPVERARLAGAVGAVVGFAGSVGRQGRQGAEETSGKACQEVSARTVKCMTSHIEEPPLRDKLTLTVPEAGALSGIPARVVRAAVLNGDMPACYAGSTTMRIRRTESGRVGGEPAG